MSLYTTTTPSTGICHKHTPDHHQILILVIVKLVICISFFKNNPVKTHEQKSVLITTKMVF